MTIGDIKRDTRSLDYSSFEHIPPSLLHTCQFVLVGCGPHALSLFILVSNPSPPKIECVPIYSVYYGDYLI